MAITKTADGTIIITGAEDTRRFAFLSQKHAMKLELAGIRVARFSVIARVKKHYGFHGNKQSVYDQFCKHHGLTDPPRPDRYGRTWPYPDNELCPTCGQPDSCGDCNHEPLTDKEVHKLTQEP